jgi:hypothetical protein
MSATRLHPYLHVANGTSVTMTLEAAGVPGFCSIWADPLHEGPVPGGLGDAELIEVRRQFLAATFGGVLQDAADPTLDPINDMVRWREAIAKHERYAELVLWFEHDVFDQLNLIQLLSWIREHVPVSKPVSLICIGSFPGRPDFKGLGELTADELAPLLETRVPVTAAQYTLAARAWQAFRQPTPEGLDGLRREDTSALPYLADAITRFLQEYPWTSDGLSRSERRLLQLAGAGPVPLAQVFPEMSRGDRFYTLTDLSLIATANALETTSPPLLSIDRTAASEQPFRVRIVATDAGRSVLGGGLDRVDACGVERWLGGVHLQGRQQLWRWDEPSGRVTRL